MTVENIWREGHRPTISPGAGHRWAVSWTLDDWRGFERDLRRAFPNVFFYENLGRAADRPERPEPRVLQRLDEPDIRRDICIMFPYPGWKPELVYVPSKSWQCGAYWTWKNYLSPQLTFGIRPHDRPFETEFSAAEPDRRVQIWGRKEILSSYRRTIPEEGRIVGKIKRMVAARSCNTVALRFRSYADFRDGGGTIAADWMRWESLLASAAVIDWVKSGPDRLVMREDVGENLTMGRLPAELVPDGLWRGLRRPKWAARP